MKFKDFVFDLPEKPNEALVELCTRLNSIDTRTERLEQIELEKIFRFLELFIAKYELLVPQSTIDAISERSLISLVKSVLQNKHVVLKDQIDDDVEWAISDFERRETDNSFGMARLNEDEKRNMHRCLDKLREIIESSDLSDRKKNALMERINKLSFEIDAIGTKTDRFFAFLSDTAFVVGDMAEKAGPMLKEVKELLKIISRARARQEGVSLPPGDEPLLLTAEEQGAN